MSIHMSQDILSATMVHLLTSQHGYMFTFSHKFHDVIVGQRLNKSEGKEPCDFALRRRNRGQSEEIDMWSNHAVNDEISLYEFAGSYDMIAISFRVMNNVDQNACHF
jgi:hypothetical protein